MDISPGESRHQTFWEMLTLVLSLMTWGDHFVTEAVAILGDNTGSQSNALALKGRGPLLQLARELAWRKAQRRWCFDVGHLPSEHNVEADALSRLFTPLPSRIPRTLRKAKRLQAPDPRSVWKLVE